MKRYNNVHRKQLFHWIGHHIDHPTPDSQQIKLDDTARKKYMVGAELFTIKNERHVEYWRQQSYPVMLVIRTSDGIARWMDVSEYLKREIKAGKQVKQLVFTGELLTESSLRGIRDRFVPPPKSE